jgi:acyl-CoA thioesterase-2
MTRALDDLLVLLDLEPIEVNIFRGSPPKEERLRVFGGQVAGQALVAAGRTVDQGTVHSLHAYFLRPGDPTLPILYEVDRIRDGRSFTTRRVVAIQRGQAIFNLSASFHVDEPGVEHQTIAMGDVPTADSLPTMHELLAPVRDRLPDWFNSRPIDMRYVEGVPWMLRHEKRPPRQRMWIRADGTLPDDRLLHACVVAYASDMSLLDTALMPHSLKWSDGNVMATSLDHAMWFHRRFRADEWLLYDQDSPVAHGARALSRGSIFTADGRLAVTVVQEGLLRVMG